MEPELKAGLQNEIEPNMRKVNPPKMEHKLQEV